MTLPCDSSRSVFPENRVGKFTTQLAREVVLEGEYEVGLSEIVMPYARRMVSVQQTITYKEHDGEVKDWTVSTGQLMSADDLDRLSVPRTSTGRQAFFFIVRANRVNFYVAPRVKVVLGLDRASELKNILGLDYGTYDGGATGENHVAPFRFNGRSQLFFIYVYCNLVEYSFVGDSMVPCLRALPMIPGEDKVAVLRFENPHYMPVSTSRFSTVAIEIADDKGEDIQFSKGLSMVKLHFRPKKR